ncbi:Ribosomal protein S20 [Candidatus Omnitrophus magneticus]|uniref:Small ribosomal subunit protein bS20 n=1 Tax=Candidatus Omnitrophus magneticus TaxID=1609969 RepID=A0A0F0CVV0_9BACT|nr:Ribosomal protein S20 [Candidatus Omnitrophus magneticus]
MPQIKSAFKSLKQAKKRHIQNKAKISEIRTLTKKVNELIVSNSNKEEAEKLLRKLESKLDRAAKTKIIKKQNASRKISRLRTRFSKTLKAT